jgi:general secretion pathway protein B
MSYILDALKKSERERRRGSLPDPLTVQEPLSHEKKGRALWPLVIVAALLINAVIFGLWFGSRYSQKAPVVGQEVNRNIQELQAKMPQSVSEIKDKQQDIPNKDIPHTEKLPTVKKQGHSFQEKDNTSINMQKTSPGNTISETPTEKEIPPPDKTKLYSLNELPSSVRQKLPDFSLSVFLYADEPASRIVRVNGNMMKEGQYLSSGLKLEEIVPDGVIFSYLNYRFRIGLQ